MATAADKFARLSALRPVGNTVTNATAPVGAPRTSERPALTDEECMLARMIGATVSQTEYGSHLSVRNWHATPEFCAPSEGVIELLTTAASSKNGNGTNSLA